MFKVGDKVKVKQGLIIDEMYGDYDFIEEMAEYSGKVVTITYVGNGYYYIKEDDGEAAWTDEMFESIKKEIKAGDKVRIRKECSLKELMADKWNLACKDTLKFFEQNRKKLDSIFTVKKVSERGNAVIVGEDGTDLYVNFNVLEVVASKAKEMTIEQVCEALGYDIKLVKSEEYIDED